jgi:hypothetical protein
MNIIISEIVTFFSSKIFDWLKERTSKDPKYFKIKNHISSSTQNRAIKELLLTSIENSLKNEIINILTPEEIRESLTSNMDLIFDWILISDKSDISFSFYSDKIKYFSNEKVFRIFYNSLFHQIQGNKNSYSELQNLMIIDRLDEIDNKVAANYELNKEMFLLMQSLSKNAVYTGEFKVIEDKIHLRQFTQARLILNSIERRVLGSNNSDEIEKYYQLLTDSYFFDTTNQLKSTEPLEKLINNTLDDKKRSKRKLYKDLLERKYDFVQKKLDTVFLDITVTEIDQSYFDIQINVFILQRKYKETVDFLLKYKDKFNNYLLWLCRIYYYQSQLNEAKQIIDSNEDYFKKDDYNIKLTKINVLSGYYLERAATKRTFENLQYLNNLIPEINETIILCEDDIGEKAQLHSILGLIYSVLNDIDNARKEYEKSLNIFPNNMNALKNYPFILVNSKNRNDREKALTYIKQYLSEDPNDQLIELLYYNTLVFLSPNKAIIELQNYCGNNEDVKPYLLYAYDASFEFNKAEELIKTFLSCKEPTSTTYFFIGLHYELLNNHKIAIDYYFKAFENGKANNELDRTVDKMLKLSILLKDQNLIKKAIEEIEEKYSVDEIIIQFIEPFSYSLLLLHDFPKCYRYCVKAIDNNIKTRNIYESLFSCYYNTQNYFLALEIIEIYIKEFSHFPQHFLQPITVCYLKTYRLNEAYNILKYLPEPISITEYNYQARFLYEIKKFNEAIIVAHKAYQNYPQNQYVMELFIDLGMIKRGDFLLSEEQAVDLRKCINNYITSNFKNSMLKQLSIDIKAEPEEILKQISPFFPDNNELENQLKLLNDQKLPVSFYKNVINRNILLIYDYLIHQDNYKIWCYNKDANHQIISNKPSIYIDIGSLLLLDTLGLLNYLSEVFTKIFVIQSIYDELHDFEKTIPFSDEKGILMKDNNGNIIYRHDSIPYNEIYEKSKRIITFINENKSIFVVGKPLEIKNKLPPELITLINSAKFETELNIIECAYLSNIPILLENTTFRDLFDSFENSPKSISTIDYMKYLISYGKISFGRYCRALSLMSSQNYASLPFNYRVLLYLIQENGFIIDISITRVFDAICSDNYNKNFTIITLVSTICSIWNIIIHNEVKYKWSNYLLDKLHSLIQSDISGLVTICNVIAYFIYNMKSQKEFISYINGFLKNLL